MIYDYLFIDNLDYVTIWFVVLLLENIATENEDLPILLTNNHL